MKRTQWPDRKEEFPLPADSIRIAPLAEDEFLRLLEQAVAGNVEARNTIALSYCPMLFKIVSRWSRRTLHRTSATWEEREAVRWKEDLFDSGFLGLIYAIEKFNFATYGRVAGSARRVFHAFMEVCVQKFVLNSIRQECKHIYVRQQTYREYKTGHKVNPAILRKMNQSYAGPVLLETKALAWLAPYTPILDLEDRLDREAEVSKFRSCIDKLDPRDRAILEFRYGLNGVTEESGEKTAERMYVSRQRIHQLHAKIMEKVKELLTGKAISKPASIDISRNPLFIKKAVFRLLKIHDVASLAKLIGIHSITLRRWRSKGARWNPKESSLKRIAVLSGFQSIEEMYEAEVE